jgi:hypothetical protein
MSQYGKPILDELASPCSISSAIGVCTIIGDDGKSQLMRWETILMHVV